MCNVGTKKCRIRRIGGVPTPRSTRGPITPKARTTYEYKANGTTLTATGPTVAKTTDPSRPGQHVHFYRERWVKPTWCGHRRNDVNDPELPLALTITRHLVDAHQKRLWDREPDDLWQSSD